MALTPAAVALAIVAFMVVGVIILGSVSARGALMNPEQYILGGRSFGTLFLWLLMAGEIYTSFTFLGAAGWAYGRGAPAFYILCYGPLAYIISFFLLPPIWRVAKRYGLLTGPDFFVERYRSKALGVLVTLVGFFSLIPYITLQLTGLQILLSIAGYGAMNATVAVGVAFMLTAIFVYSAGLRGLAWASIAKDSLILAGALFAGLVLPSHFFGSPARALDVVVRQHPGWMTLGIATPELGPRWFVSTVLLTACGFWLWPQGMAATYSAKSDATLRRNAIWMPVYNVMLVLALFAGFTALAIMPGLKGPAIDQSFMLVVQRYYPPWTLGLLAGAGCLAALIPASSQLLAASSIVVKNIVGDWMGLATSDRARTRLTQALVILVAVLAFVLWASERTTLVGLLLIGYNGVAQLLPGVVLAFAWRRVNAPSVGAGIGVSLALLAVLTAKGVTTFAGLNVGFVALVLNAVVCIATALLTPATHDDKVTNFLQTARGASV